MMLSLGSLAFLNPWLLAGLAALPVLWWLLRAIPPAPRRRLFAGVRLLLGLQDEEREAKTTPLWLLALRIAAVAAVLIGFSQPVLNPTERLAEGSGDGPVLVLMDQGWGSAPDWAARRAAAAAVLDEAREEGRQVILWPAAKGDLPPVAAPEAARSVLDSLEPAAWSPDRGAIADALEAGELPEPSQTVWFHDGLGDDQGTEALMDRLSAAGPLRLVGPATPALGLTPPRLVEGKLTADVLRADGGAAETVAVVAHARAEERQERRIAVAGAEFGEGETRASVTFDLPAELIGTVSRITLAEGASAGGAALAGGSIRRIRAGLVDPQPEGGVASLTSSAYYIEKAILPYADLVPGTLSEMLEREPAALLLADLGTIPGDEREMLEEWVAEGGLLIRFAGPRLAAAIAEDFAAAQEDPLLPVRLRRGGRVLGGALAWTSPKRLGPFAEDGPFRTLEAPDEVDVKTQVLAEPGPDLAGRVWASLEDGTPLVTGTELGEGHVVLFHVTADAEWSSLPISGLFVEMLGRLMALAPGQVPERPDAAELAGSQWRADLLVSAEGVPLPAASVAAPLPGERIAEDGTGPDLPPGLYLRVDGGARAPGAAREIVVNTFAEDDTLAPLPAAPTGATVERLGGAEALPLGQFLIAFAILLALIDTFATLWLSGRLGGMTRVAPRAAALVLTAVLASAAGTGAEAQQRASDEREAVEATAETTLGYVRTGNARTDDISHRALVGLGMRLTERTAVEPGPPMGVDPEHDELSFFPVLYWPLRGNNLPSDTALDNLAGYIANGGLLIIDTQNGASGFGGAPAVEMRRIARALDLPPLAPVDRDHVLTRTFYLLDRFPGRWRGGRVWAEAPPANEVQQEDLGIPQFDRVDDNVSPVIVGSADWAAAWAVDRSGRAMLPVGRPGDRQRELAIRFGINVVLYALTGNYKSDQVHAPAVLQRLGQ